MEALPAPIVDYVKSLEKGPPLILAKDFFSIPDSTICRQAAQHVQSYLEPWIGNHTFRTYAFALAIANYAGWDTGDAARRLGFDKELLFLSCVLHELGFSEEGLQTPMSLELWGAIQARQWILEQEASFTAEGRSAKLLHGWADEACEAIARHTLEFRGTSSRCRLMLSLLVLGSGFDLVGAGRDFVHPKDVETILELWPRSGYCQGLSNHSKLELQCKPGCILEDCTALFDPHMFEVEIFRGRQGTLEERVAQGQATWRKEDSSIG